MSRSEEITEPAGGDIAALHARKRLAFEAMQRAEREIRAHARANAWPKLVIFDCDGVLVDSEPISLALTRARLCRLRPGADRDGGARPVSRHQLVLGAQSRRRPARRKLPETFEAELGARSDRANSSANCKGVPFVREAVGALGWPVCVASSSSPERIRASLRIVGYADLFGPRVFSAHEVANGKPAPDLLLHAADTLGVAPADCLVVEDSVAGVTAAKRAGMIVFGFTGGAHHAGRRLRASGSTEAGARAGVRRHARPPEACPASAAQRGAM